jgi:hypothetical protein
MTRAKRTLPEHVLELIAVIEQLVVPLEVPYAIGGAVAMSAHGYRRHTDDVDLFVAAEHSPAVLRALREGGMLVSAMMAPHIYVAKFADETDPDVRIDILVPDADPELSAIEMHTIATLLGREVHVFTPEMIALSKFYSERPEDHRDLQKMLASGIFDLQEARRLLGLMDPGAVAALDDEVLSYRKKVGRPRQRRP